MTELFILLLIVLVVSIGIYYPGWRQKRILKKPFPDQWQSIIDQRLPFFQKLTASE
jgi:Mlc titration factor MtfA (ptsG expression regulator)